MIVKSKNEELVNVKGKKAIIIGDSHSASFNCWAQQVCVKTGMTFFNMSVSSKNTTWKFNDHDEYSLLQFLHRQKQHL